MKISSFDPALSTSMGFSATLMHYLLMAIVAVTTVASFEAVGSILVVAMLIVPPATAQLLVRSTRAAWLSLACVFAILSAVLGYWLSQRAVWNVEPAGAMAVVAGGMYGLAVLFAPQYGILSTLIRNLQTTLRILREDLLLMLYRVEEIDATQAPAAGGGRGRGRRRLARPLGARRCCAAAAASKSATANCT